MKIHTLLVAITGGSAGYSSWLAFRPLTVEERNSWNATYMENKSFMLRAYIRAPLNAASRLFGRFAHIELPKFARRPLYGLYAYRYGCNLSEATNGGDLAVYPSLSAFFRRELKPGMRPVSENCGLVSPADGTVLHLGRVLPDGKLEQVKGMSYTLQGFFGPASSTVTPVLPESQQKRVPDSAYYQDLLHRGSMSANGTGSSNQLYHCVIYLSPGDYHRFHSPADWRVAKRRHFPGYLVSVSPRKAARVGGLFCLNERAVYLGEWRHGFFAFTAIGATNVGSIGVYQDPELRTNREKPLSHFHDYQFQEPLAQAKGGLFGEFDMGSTIVLVFEAPEEFEFAVRPGQKVKVGEAIGGVV